MLIKIISSDLFCNSMYVLAALAALFIVANDLSFGYRRRRNNKVN